MVAVLSGLALKLKRMKKVAFPRRSWQFNQATRGKESLKRHSRKFSVKIF
jgi:hypothetical protein